MRKETPVETLVFEAPKLYLDTCHLINIEWIDENATLESALESNHVTHVATKW